MYPLLSEDIRTLRPSPDFPQKRGSRAEQFHNPADLRACVDCLAGGMLFRWRMGAYDVRCDRAISFASLLSFLVVRISVLHPLNIIY